MGWAVGGRWERREELGTVRARKAARAGRMFVSFHVNRGGRGF